jgi:hypothetical protein
MTDTTPTQASRDEDPKELERAHQQPQEDQGGSSGSSAQQNHAGSSGQRPAPGRKPLFGT